MPTAGPPLGAEVRYSQQYRRCGKPTCGRCAPGLPGHGPYWYASWREAGHKRSRYLGPVPPAAALAEQGQRQSSPSEPPAAAPGSAALRVRTLGSFAVWRGAEAIPATAWTRRKVTALFKCLLGAPGHRVPREELLDTLWPDAEPQAGRNNLRYTIHLLRKLLAGAEPGHRFVRLEGALVVLAPAGNSPQEAEWLDATAFAQAATAALAEQDSAACRRALARYTGDYLPDDPYDEWALTRREELRRLRLDLLVHLAALATLSGEVEEAEGRLRTVLETDQCHEVAALTLMRLQIAGGRPMQALRTYRRLADALREDLELEPEEETQALYHTLAAAREARHVPTVPAAETVRTNLPAPLTSFIGRRKEVAEVQRLLLSGAGAPSPNGDPVEAPPCRVLTLTGPGGCGKTRLAVQVADELLDEPTPRGYADGVWLVELGALTDGGLVAQTVAGVLGLHDSGQAGPARPVVEVLCAFLQPKRVLLVLDNCEHLLNACAELIATLLRACPAVQVLTTSREVLGIAGEWPWLVRSLSLPPVLSPAPLRSARPTLPDAMPPLGQLPQYEAIRLFLARARVHRPGLRLTEENAATVVQICQRLDGIPLALELAAARVAVLSLEGIAARLDDRFRLLIGGDRTALPRQRTLRATLDWSYQLLSLPEQALLRQLAVFVGGWTLAAAEAVLAPVGREPPAAAPSAEDSGPVGLGLQRSGLAVLDGLTSLVHKSLVRQQNQHAQEPLAEPRFAMLETIRAYALEQLAAQGEEEALRRHHAAYVLRLAEAAAPELVGPQQATWVTQLEEEHDNLRAALHWARARRGHAGVAHRRRSVAILAGPGPPDRGTAVVGGPTGAGCTLHTRTAQGTQR